MAVDITPSTLLEFAKTIDSEPQPTSKTRMATVTRIGDDGTPYVKFPDGTETPLAGTVSTLKIGDSVMVSMQSGKLRANANVSDPAASNERMTRTETTAIAAAKAADAASIAADAAEYDAQRAHEAADDAQASANSALASAANASEYASRALGNLSTVQSVSETLTWITQHGTMTLTTDTALDPTHVYFVQDAEGDYVVGNTHYSIVAEPVASQLSSYYVLTIDESLNNYVGTHLALTGEGLWLLPATSGTVKVLIATGAGSTYTSAGTYIIDSTGGTVAKFTSGDIALGDSNAEINLCGGIGKIKAGSNGVLMISGEQPEIEGKNSDGTSSAGLVVLDTNFTKNLQLYASSGNGSSNVYITLNPAISSLYSVPTISVSTDSGAWHFPVRDFVASIPVELYDDATASASSSATLSESAANFSRLVIFYKDVDDNYGSTEVWSPNNKRVSLSLTWINGASTQEMYQRVRWVTISGTSISTYRASNSEKYRTGQVKLGATASVTNSDYISIVHVIGYR